MHPWASGCSVTAVRATTFKGLRAQVSPEGHEILLYRLNPGESCVITVVTLLGEVSYPAIGTAETDLALLAVPRSVFLEIVLESPAFRVFVFNALSQRLAHLMALVDDVAFRRVDQRLASRLLLQREPDATTHQMLADELGTSREVVSRILETFQHAGMIRLGQSGSKSWTGTHSTGSTESRG